MTIELISMPFGPIMTPSIGLTLVKNTLLAETDYSVNINYFNLDFAKSIGPKLYSTISAGYPTNHDLLGEWIFSIGLFQKSEEEIDEYIEQIILGKHIEHLKEESNIEKPSKEFIKEIFSCVSIVDSFIKSCTNKILSKTPRIVGFTSVFQQQIASLLLAKKLKEVNKDLKIIFGGANVEGEMGIETLNQFEFVDYVVSGEGESVISNLCKTIIDSPDEIQKSQGVKYRKSNQLLISSITTPKIIDRNLDWLPIVEYDDYLEKFNSLEFPFDEKPRILFETSRGCWWGEKNHCTFCGLNGDNMASRKKSSERAIEELKFLLSKYPGLEISVVDNILSMSYFKDFIPSLKILRKEGFNINLFYEVKANLTLEQIEGMKEAGINTIQPGIESLSDSILKLMRKGVSGVQNIQLLKLCKENGITPLWNYLVGFPFEEPNEYKKVEEFLESIFHLKPPGSVSSIRLDRFSPNFFESNKHGFKNVRAFKSYSYVYPFNQEVINNIAYFFSFDYQDNRDISEYVSGLYLMTDRWQAAYEETDLLMIRKPDALIVIDFRECADRLYYVFKGIEKLVLLYCHTYKTKIQIIHYVNSFESPECENPEDLINHLVKCKILFTDGIHFLNLCIDIENYTPNKNILQKILSLNKSNLGKREPEFADLTNP